LVRKKTHKVRIKNYITRRKNEQPREKHQNHSKTLTVASQKHTIVADFTSLKGLIAAEEAEFLRKRITGIFSVYTSYSKANPLTKEELEFILKTFSKPLDEITIEEMDRAYEIGWRLFVEDPEHDPRGFILAIAAAYIRAYLRQKQKREQKEKHNLTKKRTTPHTLPL